MLSTLRVLDLTDERCYLAGFILAQLGAEVTCVDFDADMATHRSFVNPELRARVYRRMQRTVVVDQVSQLEGLLAEADVLIDSCVLPLDLGAIRARQPDLITASITPFGGTGPKAGWSATDLTAAAASGVMSLTGDPDRPPVRMSEPQSWAHAAAATACGVLIALHHRARDGSGQHVDVSVQETMMITTQHLMMSELVGSKPPRRTAGGMQIGPFDLRFVHKCADGFATAAFLFGTLGSYSQRLIDWVYDEGFCDRSLRDKNWVNFGADVAAGVESMSEYTRACESVSSFLMTKTKQELLAGSLARKLLVAPIWTTRDILESEQFEARRYWDAVEVGGRTVRVPGPFAKFVAPLNSVGMAAETTAEESTKDGSALGDLRILELAWAIAAPLATRVLADHGARVVRIESETRYDPIRGMNPFRGEFGHPEGSLQWHSVNAGKLGLALDLSLSESLDVIRDLVRWADVVIESFSPGVMDKLGLGYAELSAINPGLIMVSSSMLGQNGPLHQLAGIGVQGAALAGFFPVVGWPDRPPTGPFMAYSDYTSPYLTATAILSAVESRRRTGLGCYIDFSQVEAALHFLAPAFIEDELGDHGAGRDGNEDRHLSPHGVYRTAGEESWIALACENDAQWAALARLLGRDDLIGATEAERREQHDELNQLIGAWLAHQTAESAQGILQRAGVSAHQVQGSAECVADPQLLHRDHFVEVDHSIYGTTFVEASGFRLSRTPGQIRSSGPTFGQHNLTVLHELLGYDLDRIADLAALGALT